MSFNDRCGEAAEILLRGGALPDRAVRKALIEWCESGKDGANFPPHDLVRAVLDHPDNASLRALTSDGEWIGCMACEKAVDRALPDPIPEGAEVMWSESITGRALYCQTCFDKPEPEETR